MGLHASAQEWRNLHFSPPSLSIQQRIPTGGGEGGGGNYTAPELRGGATLQKHPRRTPPIQQQQPPLPTERGEILFQALLPLLLCSIPCSFTNAPFLPPKDPAQRLFPKFQHFFFLQHLWVAAVCASSNIFFAHGQRLSRVIVERTKVDISFFEASAQKTLSLQLPSYPSSTPCSPFRDLPNGENLPKIYVVF